MNDENKIIFADFVIDLMVQGEMGGFEEFETLVDKADELKLICMNPNTRYFDYFEKDRRLKYEP